MVKSKFSSLDVRAMVNSIRPEVVGCKLTNVYDISSRVYILKLAKRDHKRFLLLESGVRFHLTSYQRDKSVMPSNYTMKLRKHIRTKRLTDIRQLGADRCIDLTFGYGETAFHLILELYVSGNLILTDHEYRISVLLRAHSDQQAKVTVKSIYPLESATGLLTVPVEEFPDELERLLDVATNREMNQLDQEEEREDERAKQLKKSESTFAKRSKKRVQHDAFPLPQLLHKLAPFADPTLCASCITAAMRARGATCDNAFKLTIQDMSFDEAVAVLQDAATRVLAALRSVSRPDDLGGGDLLPVQAAPEEEFEEDDGDEDDDDKATKQSAGPAAASADTSKADTDAPPTEFGAIPGWILRKRVHIPPAEPKWANDEFTPLLPPQKAGDEEAALAFPTFHHCVDEFYTQLEENKAQEVKAQHAQNVFAKVERIKTDQGRRIVQLEAEQHTSERQAELIEANVELVDRALTMLNAMIASQVDWGEMWREVKRQQRLGHPIAQHIHSLDLEHNQFKFLLGLQPDDDDDLDAEDDRPMEAVNLDISLSAQKNVAKLHSVRKQTRDKTTKTVSQAEVAIKQAEKKAQQDIQKFQFKQTIRRVRQNWWFEKFLWFISSENYLVLAGRDTMQMELLFARHLAPQDIFVQADVIGAKTCFIKNPDGGEVPPATLREAGTMALCHSSAWEKRMVISAWWVQADQVCRGEPPEAADGSKVVVVDDFFVSGHRRFMPPVHLEMGFTLLFHVAGEGSAKHQGERRSRYLELMGSKAGDDPPQGTETEAQDAEEETEVAMEDMLEEEPVLPDEPSNTNADADKSEEGTARLEQQEDMKEESRPAEENKTLDNGEKAAKEEEQHERVPAADAEEETRPEDDTKLDIKGTRTRVSKAERKRQKKGQTSKQPEDDAEDASSSGRQAGQEAAGSPKAPAPASAAASKASAKPSGPVSLPRGQRSKLKKIKEKYADQDEEDREFCLALLGSKATKWAPGMKEEKQPAADQQPEAAARKSEAPGPAAELPKAATGKAPPPAAPQLQSTAAAADVNGSAPTPASASSSGKAATKKPPQKKPAVRLTAGCDAESSTVDMQLEQLFQLTGQPHADDDVLYAIPMVAPYTAMGGPYTWRVKVTPGPSKKGQCAKMCLKMLEAQLDRAAWRQLVQAIPENEVATLMCGSSKLSMPGMQKLQQLMKKEKLKEVKAKEEKKLSAQQADGTPNN